LYRTTEELLTALSGKELRMSNPWFVGNKTRSPKGLHPKKEMRSTASYLFQPTDCPELRVLGIVLPRNLFPQRNHDGSKLLIRADVISMIYEAKHMSRHDKWSTSRDAQSKLMKDGMWDERTCSVEELSVRIGIQVDMLQLVIHHCSLEKGSTG
jgi:hypothetical protein